MPTAAFIVLAEDLAGARFVEGYLVERGVHRRAIRTLHSPKGSGSGKQWVTAQYPLEVRAYRAKCNHTAKALLVTTDADEQSVSARQGALAAALQAAAVTPRTPNEAIVLVIPKWEIETWALHLLEEIPVSEDAKTGWPSARSERDCPKAGALLAAHRAGSPTCCPPSMLASDAEFARLPAP